MGRGDGAGIRTPSRLRSCLRRHGAPTAARDRRPVRLRRSLPSAATRVARIRLSHVKPTVPMRYPRPPDRVRPPTPVSQNVPPVVARSCGDGGLVDVLPQRTARDAGAPRRPDRPRRPRIRRRSIVMRPVRDRVPRDAMPSATDRDPQTGSPSGIDRCSDLLGRLRQDDRGRAPVDRRVEDHPRGRRNPGGREVRPVLRGRRSSSPRASTSLTMRAILRLPACRPGLASVDGKRATHGRSRLSPFAAIRRRRTCEPVASQMGDPARQASEASEQEPPRDHPSRPPQPCRPAWADRARNSTGSRPRSARRSSPRSPRPAATSGRRWASSS